nr:ATP synthase F0 subunit 8 [Callitettix versicolor]ACD77280.1 ATP synthase F0 subunit 8 [Callitettix versicolor]
MAPMPWMMLFMMFMLSYMIFNMNIYFLQNFMIKKKNNKIMTLQMNWKW